LWASRGTIGSRTCESCIPTARRRARRSTPAGSHGSNGRQGALFAPASPIGMSSQPRAQNPTVRPTQGGGVASSRAGRHSPTGGPERSRDVT